jgi:hypothetical protein
LIASFDQRVEKRSRHATPNIDPLARLDKRQRFVIDQHSRQRGLGDDHRDRL